MRINAFKVKQKLKSEVCVYFGLYLDSSTARKFDWKSHNYNRLKLPQYLV